MQILHKNAVPAIFSWTTAELLRKKKRWEDFWKNWTKKEINKILIELVAEKKLKNLIVEILNGIKRDANEINGHQEVSFDDSQAIDASQSNYSFDGSSNTIELAENNIPFYSSDIFVNEVVITSEEAEIKTPNDTESSELNSVQFSEDECVKKFSFHLRVEKLYSDDKAVHFFTGLQSYKKFLFVYQTLGTAVESLSYIYGTRPTNINALNQFFLTLIILRQHKTYYEISMIFSINEKQVGNIFITWIRFLYLQWSDIPQWPSKDLVSFFTPTDFRFKFPGSRATLDATEIKIQTPGTPAAQQCTFSTYKNTNTVKTITTVTPGGLVSNTSPTYAGSTSDRQIIERSNIFKMCDPGDSILADKGFNIQDLLAPYYIKLNIPSFFKKKNQLSTNQKISDKKISSKRIHVERLIGLGKTYKILKGPLNASQTLLSEEIVFVCYMLCNFRNPIVDPDA